MKYLGLSLLLLSFFVRADEDVLTQIDSTRADISNKERSQREVMGNLFSINQRIHKISKKRSQLTEQLLESDAQARALAQGVSEMEQNVSQQAERLNSHLRQLYQNKKMSSFQWLFSAKSPNQLEKHFRFMRKFLDMDHRLLKEYAQTLETLNSRRKQLNDRVANLASLQKSIASQEIVLAKEQKVKAKMLLSLKKDKNDKIAELQGLRQQHASLNDVVQYAFFEKRGTLISPVSAPRVRDFGTYVDPDFHFRLTHKGVFYRLPESEPVVAVSPGAVVFATSLPGYGRAVILDHGDNYYTVYAHCESLKVSRGQVVKEGDVVAASGDTSSLFGPGLYFEIRHFSDAIDPRPWFKDSSIKTAHSGLSAEEEFP